MFSRLFADPTILRPAFRAVAFAEAASWAGLLIGMYIKYLGSGAEIGVQVFGPIHGVLFLLYIVVALLTWRIFSWSPAVGVSGVLAAIPPFATVAFDVWVERTGRLDAPASAVA